MHELTQPFEHKPGRLQISVLGLMGASALLGAGGGCLLAAFDTQQSWHSASEWRRFFALLQFLSAGPLIGAGLLAPAHQTRLGAYVGFFVGIIAGMSGLLLLVEWGAELPGVLWQLRHVIGFSLMAIVLAVISVVQRTTAKTEP